MKKKIVTVLLLVFLTLSLSAFVFASEEPLVIAPYSDTPVAIAQIKGAMPDLPLKWIMDNITQVEWMVVNGTVTEEDLSKAVMLITVLSDKSQNYSSTEVEAINNWLAEGGKTIWVCGDSDFGTDWLRIETANALLEDIGSVLRIEHCAAQDAVSHGGAGYRVLSVTDNIAKEFEFLSVGVKRALTHSPGPVIAYSDGKYWKLEEEPPSGVYVLLTTSKAGIIVEENPPFPEVHEIGDEGNFTTMAVEVDSMKRNLVIVEGEAPFGAYMPMYYPEKIRPDRYGKATNPQQGGKFFENLISLALINAGQMSELQNEVNSLTGISQELTDMISTMDEFNAVLEGEVESLTSEVASLETDVSDFESQVASLESTKASLESQVTELEGDLTAAKSSASSWQMYAIAALIIGAVIGFFVGPMLKK